MRYTLENFNAFRDECHTASVNAGWWKGSERYSLTAAAIPDRDRYVIPAKLCLVHSEISEAYEGYATGAMDEHLPDLLNAPVELGDGTIRVADLSGYLKIDMNAAIMLVLQADHFEAPYAVIPVIEHGDREYITPESWFNLFHDFTSAAMEGYRKGAMDRVIPSLPALNANLARIVILSDLIARMNQWDLPYFAETKMVYNAIRPDHKAEVRALENGKKF